MSDTANSLHGPLCPICAAHNCGGHSVPAGDPENLAEYINRLWRGVSSGSGISGGGSPHPLYYTAKDLHRLLAEEEPPLPVAAARKGYWVENANYFAPDLPVPPEWYIHLITDGEDVMGCRNGEVFTGDTYALAEAKARKFLLTLPDKEGCDEIL